MKKSIISTIILTSLLTACGGSDTKAPVAQVSPTTGIWHAPAYGWIFDIKADKFDAYQTTENFCQTWDTGLSAAELIESFVVSADGTTTQTTLSESVVMTKQQSLPESCVSNLIAQSSDDNYQFDALQEFEIFWQTFNEYYAFFNLENVDWNESYQSANSQISATTTEAELFSILSNMVAPLKDFHVQLENESLDLDFEIDRKANFVDIAEAEFINEHNISGPLTEQQESDISDYIDQAINQFNVALINNFSDDVEIKSNDTETLFWAITPDNLAYFLVETMDIDELTGNSNTDEAKKSLNASLDLIISDFSDVDGLIIDVRINGGGDDFVSQIIVSRLIAQDLHVYSKQARLADKRTPLHDVILTPSSNTNYTGPVAVLISATTASAAEVFSMAMRERDNTILVGEATAGGFSDMLDKSLPHGLEFSLSNEFYVTPSGEEFEGSGVPPDIEQAFFTREQRENEQDLGFDKAIEWLLQQN